MKKIIITILVTFCMNVVQAQKERTIKRPANIIITKAPKKILSKFTNEFPNVTPAWKLDGQNYQATYTDPATGLKHSILYDKEGNLLLKENEMDYKEYPVTINQYYSRRFPDEKFRIIQCEGANGTKYYYSKRKNDILKFDTTGNFISGKVEKGNIPEINMTQNVNEKVNNTERRRVSFHFINFMF